MRSKGDEEFYNRLSRKDLQYLCKRYGLPANKSSSDMAKSVASYFGKNSSSVSSRERFVGIQEVSLPAFTVPGLQPGSPFISLEDPRDDGHGLNSCFREENRRIYLQSGNTFGHCMGDKTCDEEGLGRSICSLQETSNSQEGVGPIQHIDLNFGSCPKENVLPSSMRTSKKNSSSSFEFYVHSEEGINLFVDLNASPSDWVKKLKSEVNICENACNNKSPSFHHELGRFGDCNKQIESSFLQNVDLNQVKDGHIQSGSSPSTFMKENKNAVINHSDGCDGSLTSIAIKPCCMDVDGSEQLHEDQGLILLEPNSVERDCTRSSTDENGCMKTLDSDVNTPGEKLSPVVNIPDCSINLDTLKHQNEYSTLKNSCSPANSQVVIAGCMTGGSMEIPPLGAEIQQKDASCMPCKNGEFLDLVDPVDNAETEQSALASSSEPDIDIGRNHLPTSHEEWGRKKLTDGGESSECSQLDDLLGKPRLKLDDVEFNEVCHKKRHHLDSEDQNGHCKPDAKILRSTKKFSGKFLPRRSKRLVSKVIVGKDSGYSAAKIELIDDMHATVGYIV